MNESEDKFFDLEARKRLSQTIVAWMDAAGTNRNRLAISTGMSRNTLNAILKGSRSASLEVLAQLAVSLNTSIGALVDGSMPAGKPFMPPVSAPDRLQELSSRLDALAELPAQVQDLAKQLREALTDLQSMRTLLQSRGIS